ncbi:MAG: M1 family metallopeptidase [Acidobacteria bacterium]|nr:M1 family metallopeptidase [Acidobacteriota bacterium]
MCPVGQVLEQDYKPSKLRNYLRHELDVYLRGRGSERRKEPPMAYVQAEGYVWYQKGSLVMYALKDYIGEERLNRALRSWLEAVRFQPPPYTNSMEFLAALRKETPEEYQYLIKDMFENIILFDNKAVEATYAKRADGKFDVKLKLATSKLRADGLGKESAIAINDPIDVAVFAGEESSEKTLYLAKHKFSKGETELNVVVDEEPTRAGVDPFIKLIDRKPDDNIVAVAKR